MACLHQLESLVYLHACIILQEKVKQHARRHTTYVAYQKKEYIYKVHARATKFKYKNWHTPRKGKNVRRGTARTKITNDALHAASTTRWHLRNRLVLTLPNELCPKWVRWYAAYQGTKDFQPGRQTLLRVQNHDAKTHHLVFSSSESAKNRISCPEGKTSLKERSTAISES